MSRFTILVFALSLVSCSTIHRAATSLVGGMAEHTVGRAPNDAPESYRAAVANLEEGKFADALTGLDTFTQQNAASPWSQAAVLNSGRALEGLARWNEAITQYRQVIASTSQAPRLQAMALYRLSYCHEALGDDPQVVADLRDVVPRSRSLPPEIGEAEMPARLAAAYARVGNFERAQEFYRRAEAGIARLRQASKDKAPEWLPKTLFLMGESSHRQIAWADFEIVIRPFARSQIYLAQCSELEQEPWSARATDELLANYESMISVLQSAPLPGGDPLLARREIQTKRWERLGLVNDTLGDLRARLAPDLNDGPATEKLKDGLAKIETSIAAMLLERPAGEGLTESAIARRKSKQPLKALATDDTLEQQFLKSGRDTKPTQSLVPVALPEQKPITETPPTFEQPEPIRAVPGESPSSDDPNL